MNITYHTSTVNPEYTFAAVDDVVVAMYCENRWNDRCIYRPLRPHYQPTNWTGTPYDPAIMVAPEEFEIVKTNKREATPEEKDAVYRALGVR